MQPVKALSLLLLLVIPMFGLAAPSAPGGTPLSFVENKGQVADQENHARADIGFKLATTAGLNIFIGSGAIHYQFSKSNVGADMGMDFKMPHPGQPFKPLKQTVDMYRMDVSLVGANPNAIVVKEQQQAYFENHYTTSKEQTDITAHAYNKITYKEVYPHIDWVLYTKDGRLKYEFVIHAGGTPADILLQYNGASALSLNDDGSLSATTPQGVITEDAPYTYQQDGKKVESSYRLQGNILSFVTGKYTGDLVIDPSLEWATYYGGSNYESVAGITTERNGNVYVVGPTSSTSDIATTGAYQVTMAGTQDAYLAKFTPAGVRLWATYFGGVNEDIPYGIASDTAGHVYICGYSSSPAGVATAGTHQSTLTGSFSAGFLAKFDTAGARIWGTYLGGGYLGYDIAYGVAADNVGNIYLTGVTSNSTSIASAGAFQPTFAGGTYDGDAFLVKFDNTGNRVWGTYFGGLNDDFGRAVSVDRNGDVFIAGYTNTSGGLATTGAHQLYGGGGSDDGFIAKFTGSGTRLWSTYYGGNDRDEFIATLTDTSGNLYLCGNTGSSSAVASAGAHQTVFNGFLDGTLVKFSGAGTRLWATYYGGSSTDYANAVAISDSGNVYLAGGSRSSGSIATFGAYHTSLSGTSDGFVAKFNGAGTRLWGTYYGGFSDEGCNAAVMQGTNLYFGGSTQSTTGIATPASHQSTFSGGIGDGFLVKFEDCPTMVLTSYPTPPAICDSTLFAYIPASNIPGATLTWARAAIAGISNPAATGTGNIGEVLVNTTVLPVVVAYTYTITSGTCSDTQSIYVTVQPRAVLTSSVAPNTCSGGLFSYTPTTLAAGATYTWTRNMTVGIANPAAAGTGGITEMLINTTSSPVVATYKYTITSAGCTDTQSIHVNVIPLPVLTSAHAITVCSGVPFTYIPISSSLGSTFSWVRPLAPGVANPAGSGSGAVNATLVNTTTAPVTARVIYTTAAYGCSSIDTLFITILPPLPPAIIAGADSVCVGDTISLSASVAGGAWGSAIGNASVSGGVVTGITPGVDTITYITTDTCRTARATHVVVVKTAAQCNNGVHNLYADAMQLDVYPNPNSGEFDIKLSSATNEEVIIHVVDVVGIRVYEGKMTSNQVREVKLNVAPGIYSLSATTVQGKYVRKVIVR